jgi:crossover junction endodeoxyribonuclease RusA
MTSIKYVIDIQGMDPAPQGSKIRTRFGMREACKRVAPWRDAVRTEALAAHQPLIESACTVTAEFRFLRPVSHLTTKGLPSKSFKEFYTVKKNDIDKCCRSLLDGLSGSAYVDDALVVGLTSTQRYCKPGERPGALVTVEELA